MECTHKIKSVPLSPPLPCPGDKRRGNIIYNTGEGSSRRERSGKFGTEGDEGRAKQTNSVIEGERGDDRRRRGGGGGGGVRAPRSIPAREKS